MNLKKIKAASEIAVMAHADVRHYYGENKLPYAVHLAQVYEFGQKYVNNLPNKGIQEVALVACWTHDMIEDCRLSYNDIKNKFSPAIAEATYALSNEKGKNRAARANKKYYMGIRANRAAWFVKICDRMANIKYSMDAGSSMYEMYKKEHEKFKSELYADTYKNMFDEMDEMFDL